ncbi:MAG: glycosyltransferase [Acidobacteriaceae bacterium]|nr:glycosyltransferase [Acidobacteriaceae bacterium]
MQIAQAVFGVFHHFELARELEKRGHLQRVYSTWPWRRLQREGIAQDKVATFPWLHTAQYLAGRAPVDLRWLTKPIDQQIAPTFDHWQLRQFRSQLSRKQPLPDALISISGASHHSGIWLQEHGGRFICDRGSSHHRYQMEIVSEEFARWKVPGEPVDIRNVVREEEIYRVADAITVPSSFAARSFIEMGVPAEKVHRIPYGVRLERFQSGPIQSEGEFNVLFAGQVGIRKGVPYLLQAFKNLPFKKKTLRIVGAVQPEIKNLLGSFQTENVEFLGSLPQDELIGLMQRSHLLVLPSIEEGLALVQAQALACGCPILCSTNTGGEDLITDGVEGYVVPVRDVQAMTERMERLAGDRELWLKMREAALLRVQHLGGWSSYGDQWETLLRTLTGKQ